LLADEHMQEHAITIGIKDFCSTTCVLCGGVLRSTNLMQLAQLAQRYHELMGRSHVVDDDSMLMFSRDDSMLMFSRDDDSMLMFSRDDDSMLMFSRDDTAFSWMMMGRATWCWALA
jgi:hypothetical protein